MLRRVIALGLVASLGLFVAATMPRAEEKGAASTAAKSAAQNDSAKKKEAAEGKQEAEQKFLRVVRDAQDVPQALDTAVVRYIGETGKYAGCTVDLIGAVHIGDKRYYEALNQRFAKYDALLYELLAPKGTRIPKGGGKGRSWHPIGFMQEGMTDVLGLAYQLREVDYTKGNFVHADMTPKQFDATMEKRGESWMGMMFKAMGQGIAIQAKGGGGNPEMEMLFAMFDSNRELKMKRALAKQFEDMEGMMSAFEGEEGSTIITERNKAAFKVLARQLEKGKKMVGVFYGAGHLADMDERLLKEFGLKRQATEWLTAWDLREPVKQPKADKKAPAKKVEQPAEKSAEAK